jgi:regulator of PEP synthase PpsR (kinase-PPPase family)
LYDKYDLKPLDVTSQSIEELAAQIVRTLKENKSTIQLNHSKDI